MTKVADTVAKAGKRVLGRNETNVRSLVHSAFDLSDNLYDFANWITDESFITSANTKSEEKSVDVRQPGFDLKHPIAFDNFNGNK